jgi:antirestriction protein
MLKIYIANLGKYNEGQLVGEWVTLPATSDDLEAVYTRIGINSEYEETAIHDFETDLPISINEYDNVSELSEMVEQFEALDDWERETVEAILEAGYYSDINEAIEHVGSYNLITEASNNYDLGYYFYECGCIEIPDHLRNYFDFAAYGRDISFDGTFTANGFLLG